MCGSENCGLSWMDFTLEIRSQAKALYASIHLVSDPGNPYKYRSERPHP